MKVVAIDQGTTGTKSFTLDETAVLNPCLLRTPADLSSSRLG